MFKTNVKINDTAVCQCSRKSAFTKIYIIFSYRLSVAQELLEAKYIL